MIITGSIKKAREVSRRCQRDGKTIGFVPTMGALHEGHLSLVNRARNECDFLVVSIFVNPFQFGPKEDYRRYPRNLKKDAGLLKEKGVDLLFCPQAKTMYFKDSSVRVRETKLSKVLCGKLRPGHFEGVCLVLAKLFNIVGPNIVYFGQKDYQQALIVKRMVRDLNFFIKIKILPIIREKDNLAMSSRVVYLTAQGKKDSTCLYSALSLAKKLIKQGERNPKKIINKMRKDVVSKNSAKIDYIKIMDAFCLKDLTLIKGKVLIALAVFVGKTRLIDNIILDVK